MLLSTVATNALTSLFDTDVAYNISITGFLLIICAAIACGIGISVAYVYNRRKDLITQGMAFVLVLVPVAASVVIMMVGRNIAAGLGMSGLFVLVRFRSGPVEVKDLAYLFAAICSGILNGCGYVAYGILFTVILVGLIFAMEFAKWGNQAENAMILKIWIPESLNFQNTFDSILKRYTEEYTLLMVRTTDFGSNCELRYRIIPKKGMNQKKLIDDIRVKNGNMNVMLILAPSLVDRGNKQMY